MLVGAIARELLTKHQVDKLEAVLRMWEADYPGLSSLATAPVWADHIKCTDREAEYCRGLRRLDSIELFDQWHWIEMLYNPQNLPLSPQEQAAPFPSTGAVWALRSAFWSLTHRINERGTVKRRQRFAPRWKPVTNDGVGGRDERDSTEEWKLFTGTSSEREDANKENETLRKPRAKSSADCRGDDCDQGQECEGDEGCQAAISVARRLSAAVTEESPEHFKLEDLHGSKFSLNLELRLLLHIIGDLHQPLHAIDCVSKLFRGGDLGGGLVKVKMEGPQGEKITSLHQLWDSVAGSKMKSWPDLTEAEVVEQARELMERYPRVRLFDEFEDESEVDLKKVAEQSHRIAIKDVYAEFDWKTLDKDFLPYRPSPEYIAESALIAEKQIVRGGHRLARMLRYIASHLPPLPKDVSESSTSAARSSGWLREKSGKLSEETFAHKDAKSRTETPHGWAASFFALVWHFVNAASLWFVTGATVGFVLCFSWCRGEKMQVSPTDPTSYYRTLG